MKCSTQLDAQFLISLHTCVSLPSRKAAFAYFIHISCPSVIRQCPGTVIERNFEVGASLDVSFTINTSSTLTALHRGVASTERSLSRISRDGPRRSQGSHAERITTPFSRRLGAAGATRTLGEGGATFTLGDDSEIRFSGGATTDGTWSPLEDSSTTDGAAELVAAISKFESTAVYSIILLPPPDREINDAGTRESGPGSKWPFAPLACCYHWVERNLLRLRTHSLRRAGCFNVCAFTTGRW